MKIVKSFLNVFLTAQIIIQAVLYFAIFLIQSAYPRASWLQFLIAAAFLLVIQAIFIKTGSNGSEALIQEKESDDI